LVSWPWWRGRISAGVFALPRSWVSAAKARRQRRGQARRHVDHHHHMHAGVDLGVVVGTLRHAPQGFHFRQQARQRAALAQHGKHARGLVLHQAACQFLPHPLGHQGIDFAGGDHLAHQGHGFRRHREIGEARGEARHAQDAHRVLGEGRRHMPHHARGEVGAAAVGIDQRAAFILGNGVDGQVAAQQVVFQRHLGCGMHHEAGVARRRLALGARQRVFLVAFADGGRRESRGRPGRSPVPASRPAWRRPPPSRGP
jgi:hypothetical protein